MRTISPCAVLLLAGVAATADGLAYTIKLKTYPDKGQGLLCRDTEKNTSRIRFLDDKAKPGKEQNQVEESEEAYLLTVLAGGDKVPERYTHTFDKATQGNGVRTQPKSYEGHKLEFELRDGKYHLKTGPRASLSDEEKQALAEKANSDLEAPLDGMFQPPVPVEVGDGWSIDTDLLQKAFGRLGKLDLEKTRGQGRLEKAYKKDGTQFGVIEVKLSIAFKEMDDLKFDPPAVLHLKAVLDSAIDGSSCIGTLTTTSTLSGKGQLVRDKTSRPLEIVRESTAKKERSNPEP